MNIEHTVELEANPNTLIMSPEVRSQIPAESFRDLRVYAYLKFKMMNIGTNNFAHKLLLTPK